MNPILSVAVSALVLLPLCYLAAWIAAKAESRREDRKPAAMARALAAIRAEGGCTADYSATLAALRTLQFAKDDEAAQLVYIIWAAESERQGNTWTAVEERMAA